MTADRIKALEQALRNGSQADMDGVMVTVSRQACEEAADILAAIAASRAAPDCHQQDLVTAEQVRVKPLVWDECTATASGCKLEHMTADRSYKVVEWYDGSGHVLWFGQAGKPIRIDASAAAVGIDALKAAAQADYEARIISALDLTPAPAVEPVARRTFPILGSNGARIDYQLVTDHGGQAKENHYQTVDRLAERGGLSWCELHAVLNNRKYTKIDQNTAIKECRAIEVEYLASIAQTAQDAARVPEIAALIDAANRLGLRALVSGWNGEGRDTSYTPHKSELSATIKTTCGTVYAIDAALRAIGGDA